MAWYIMPFALLIIGLIGLYLNIRSYKKGESISLKKLLIIGMLIFLGAGVFLQKLKVVNIPQLEQLLLAFDTEEREKREKIKIEQQQKKKDSIASSVQKDFKEAQERANKQKAEIENLKNEMKNK